MKLYGTTTSPYVRKVRILATAAGVPFDLVDTRSDAGAAELARLSPLGKVPVVELPDGRALPDSGLVAAWLWAEHAPALSRAGFSIPPDAFADRALQIVVEGALDAAINRFYLRRDGFEDLGYVARQRERAGTSLRWLEGRIRFARPVGHAALSLGCALDWLAFREPGYLAALPGLQAFQEVWRESGIGKGTEPE